MHTRIPRGASKALGAADAQSDEPWLSFVPLGWPEGYDAERRCLNSLEFTTATNTITDRIDVDEILC
jgi:hypothetical protein